LPSVLSALRTNINRAIRDTPFNLVYGADTVLPPEIYLESTRVARELHIKDKHKFLSPWEGPFIIVDIAAPGAYALMEVDGGMLPNTWNAYQLRK
jgi:hypothetical protein